MYLLPYSVPFFFSGIILFAMGLYAWNIMRNDRAGIAFGAVLCLSAFWAVIQGMDMMTFEPWLKLIWLRMRVPVIELLSISMLVLTARYTMHDSWPSPSRLAALSLVPVLTAILLWSDKQPLFREVTGAADAPFPLLLFRNGPWFWVHAGFCYGLHAAALARMPPS